MGDALKTTAACGKVFVSTAIKASPAIAAGYTKAAYKGTVTAVEEGLPNARANAS